MDYALVAKTFDQLQNEGIIGGWAIAGGSAALFYVEPFVTFDVDIFVAIEQRNVLLNLDPFHGRLRALGHDVKGEHVDIGGVPVQIIVPPPGVESEALAQAQIQGSGDKEIKIVTAEHLMAICLKIGRPKDKLRLEMFIDEQAFDQARLESILARHGLIEKWRHFLTNRD